MIGYLGTYQEIVVQIMISNSELPEIEGSPQCSNNGKLQITHCGLHIVSWEKTCLAYLQITAVEIK